MLDVDYFKHVNDTYGHQVGDEVLIMIADAITQTCRQTDSVGRYGGEEFLIVLPQTDSQQAYELAERIRKSVASISTQHPFSVSCSIGVATFDETLDMHTLIKRADEAVYNAKEKGRNCVSH